MHDCWAFTGHCTYFDFVNCDKWQKHCEHCPQTKEYPSSLKDNSYWNYEHKRRIFTLVDNMTIVTPSQWLADLIRKSFFKHYSIKVIHNGVDSSVFKPTKSDFKEKYGLDGKKIILGVAGLWEKRKGLYDFIKLSQLLGDDYKVILVGVNKKQANTLPNNVIKISRTENIKELAEIYSAADVYVNTTYEDNFPTTNLEALMCGTPVITYNTGGSVESVINKDCIVPKGDIIQVAEKIKSNEYLKKDFYDPMIFDARKETCFERYFEIYREIGEY